MKKNWGGFLALAMVIVSVVSALLLISRSKTDKPPPSPASAPAPQATIETNPPTKLSAIRRAEFSEGDMADFTNRFEKRFKPAIARWCKVYKGRLPFSESDVTIDKFHSKIGGFLYTFMIGSTTFTVYDGPEGTRVFYMMTRQAATQLGSPAGGGTTPNVSTPVTRPVITGLLKADSGTDYPADQISIHPTGQFSALPGGVAVEAGGITGNNVFRAMTNTNLDFVLDANGILVSYQH